MPTTVPDARDSAKAWEFRELSMPRGTSRETARQLLTGAAEIDRWELDRVRIYPDGRRRIWLRRRIYRVTRTT
ncbi:MAG: DUF5703 family protein [Actinomycetales bacterium]|jgi:hypothetical protein